MLEVEVKLHCVVCKDPLSFERITQGADTCIGKKPSCKVILRRIRRELARRRKCKQCGNPSTPEERKIFKRWRKDMIAQGIFPKPERKPYLRRKRVPRERELVNG